MGRKYLEDLKVDTSDDWGSENDSRQKHWDAEKRIYGFDSRETWCLDYCMAQILYERLMMYLEEAGKQIDLDSKEFPYCYDGKEYSLREIIEKIIIRMKFRFSNTFDLYNKRHTEFVNEGWRMWADINGAVWW